MDLQNRVLDSIGRMTDGVVHQFNNQLTVIQGYSDMLLRQLPGESPSREAVEEIDRAARRATNLTAKLLAFSGRQVLQPRRVDLCATTRRIAAAMKHMLPEKAQVRTDLPDEPAYLLVDPKALERSILSMVENAVEAIAETGWVSLEVFTRSQDGSGRPLACLKVSDSGVGMDEETRSHLFEPFYSTKQHGNEAGMSLAVLHGFVYQSGGHVTVESEPGQGTSMTICFPAAKPAEIAVYPLPDTGNETIVLAAESDAMTRMLAEWLDEFGYNVLTASSPVESAGLVMQSRGQIAAMVQDLRFYRQSEQNPPLLGPRGRARVLYLQTRMDAPQSASQIASIPWTQRISAPFGPHQLASALRQLLDAPSLQRSSSTVLTGKGGQSRSAGIGQWLSESEPTQKILSEQEWNLISRHLPKRRSSRKGGRKLIDNRLVVEGIAWVLRYDRRWEDLPELYPSARTCRRRLHRWKDQGIWEKIRPIVLGETTPEQLIERSEDLSAETAAD
ncbi:MAG: transposase [Phycisphaerae bacterium]